VPFQGQTFRVIDTAHSGLCHRHLIVDVLMMGAYTNCLLALNCGSLLASSKGQK